MAALTSLPSRPAGLEGPANPVVIPGGQESSDGYRPPGWLRNSLPICFDGSSPPIYPHMRDFDAQRLVKGVLELGADLLRFEPVVRWAYYPTKAYPMHPELGSRDLVEEVSRECRKAGIHVYCYCKYGNPFMKVGWVDNHPEYADWVLRGPDGKPYGTFESGDDTDLMQKPDATGDAYRQAIHQVVRELCNHDIDGVYFDAPGDFGYTDICYCPTCRRNFRAFSGMDIDRLQNPDDMEARIAWFRWFQELNRTDMLDFRKIIHGSGKFMFCHNGATWQGTAVRVQYRIPDGFMVEHSTQTYQRMMTGLMGASMARPYKKVTQMYLGSYCVADFNQPPHSHPWYQQNSDMEDGDEILMEGFTILATGNAPFYYGAARLYYGIGSGSAKPAQDVFALMHKIELIHRDSVPVPYVTVMPTWGAQQLWRTRRRSWNMVMSEGLSLAMLDERINLDVCPSTELTANWLQSQRVIALCGASGISDDEVTMLADWVKGGGGLLATYDTGLYDENGRLRPGGH